MRHSVTVPTLVFLAFFLPRVFGLGAWVNTDGAAYWFERTERFWDGLSSGDLVKTIPAPHPGVTLTWLAGASVRIAQAVGALDLLPTESNPRTKADALPYAALPVALVTSLFGVGMYVACKRLTGSTLGGVASVAFLALDPWWSSQSRQLHLDALAISFSFSGLFLYPLAPTNRSRLRRLLAGVAFGLGILTRFSSALVPAVLGLYLLLRREAKPRRQRLRELALSALAGAVTIVLLWPVIAIHPRATIVTLRHGVGWALRDVDLPYAAGLPSWLEWTVDPLVLLTRLPIFALVVLAAVLARRQWRAWSDVERLLGIVGVAYFFIIWYAPKTLDRYLLPAVVSAELLAGAALYRWWRGINRARLAVTGALVGLALIGAWQLVRFHPNEGLSRNTLFRVLYPSLAGRSEAMLLGWGEGLPQAARYLETLEGFPTATSWYDAAFAPFYDGRTVTMHDLASPDVVVIYQNQIVRSYFPELLRAIHESGSRPLFVGTLAGRGIVWVYRTPPEVRTLPTPIRKVIPGSINLTRSEMRNLLQRRGESGGEL